MDTEEPKTEFDEIVERTLGGLNMSWAEFSAAVPLPAEMSLNPDTLQEAKVAYHLAGNDLKWSAAALERWFVLFLVAVHKATTVKEAAELYYDCPPVPLAKIKVIRKVAELSGISHLTFAVDRLSKAKNLMEAIELAFRLMPRERDAQITGPQKKLSLGWGHYPPPEPHVAEINVYLLKTGTRVLYVKCDMRSYELQPVDQSIDFAAYLHEW